MSDTLRDQLLGLGFKPAPKPERKPDTRRDGRPQGRPAQARPQAGNKPGNKPGHAGRPAHGPKAAHCGPQGQRKPRSQEDIDLAKAYEEMGDLEGARELLQEVVKEGDSGQREKAQALLAKIGA